MEKNILELRNITKDYDGQVVLKGISLNIKQGEFVTLLGPSGCGKSTTLRIIAGLESPNNGEIYFQGDNLLTVPVYKRQINTVFQNYALFPHFNVFDNISYGLGFKDKKLSKNEIKKQVKEYLDLVNLPGYEDKKIDQLSGGEKQRVAIARALINKPKILLLDEPMAALDIKLRKKMQIELKKIQQEIGITFVLVTHDQEEALTLSDRIIVISSGQIQQIGTPEDIYNEPENLWTAQFIGESNIIDNAIFVKDYKVKIDNKEFPCVDRGFGENQENIDIVIRPEDIDILKKDNGFFNGKVISVLFKGVHWEIIVQCENRNYIIHTTDHEELDNEVAIKWNTEDIHVMWKDIDV